MEQDKTFQDLDRAEFMASKSPMTDNGVTFYKAIQKMNIEGLHKYKYTDQAQKKPGKDYTIYVTISRNQPWYERHAIFAYLGAIVLVAWVISWF